MLRATLGWLLGVWCLQQQVALFLPWMWAIPFALLALLGLRWWVLKPHYAHRAVFSFIIKSSVLNHLFIVCLAFSLGFAWAQARAHWRLQDALPYSAEQKPIRVQALVVGVPEPTERGLRFEVRVEHVFTPNIHVPHSIMLSWYSPASFQQDIHQKQTEIAPVLPPVHAGERWQWTVKLKRPHSTYNPHGFDAEAYALAEGIRANGYVVTKASMLLKSTQVYQLRPMIAAWREHVGKRITRVLGQNRISGVIRALVIGEDSQIDRADWQLFVNTGINHLVSISGLHITMLAGLAYGLCLMVWRRFPRWSLVLPATQAASMAGMLVALAYSALAGFSVPTQRTLLMLMTVALLLCWRRQLAFSRILALALFVVLLLDPWAVLAPGFWLSFGAVGMMAYAMGGRLRAAPAWVNALHSQWVVTIGFVPIVIALFNQCSFISPIANAFAIPVVSFLVVPFAIAGAVLPLDWPLHLAAGALSICLKILAWLAQWPWAVWIHATPTATATMLAMLGVLVMMLPKGVPLRYLGVCLWLPLLQVPNHGLHAGEMRATIIDVGQGLSVLVQTQHHTLLYDAGPRYGAQSDAGQRIVVPYLHSLGIQRLNTAIISHDDADHVGGMASVLSVVPAQTVASSLTPEATFFTEIAEATPSYKLHHVGCAYGQHWQWDGVTFDMLYPQAPINLVLKDNDKSCVLKVSTSMGSLLLTGDIEKLAESNLIHLAQAQLPSTIMTMPHHGSKTSSSADFLAAVQPQYAIATNGYLNRFGHPKAQVIQRYLNQDVQVYRSDQAGALIVDFKKQDGVSPQAWRQLAPHYWQDTYATANASAGGEPKS